MEKRNLVQVRYRGRRSGKFEGDAYTYVADVPLEVVNVLEEEIPAWCGMLRHITEAAVPQDMFSEFFA